MVGVVFHTSLHNKPRSRKDEAESQVKTCLPKQHSALIEGDNKIQPVPKFTFIVFMCSIQSESSGEYIKFFSFLKYNNFSDHPEFPVYQSQM